MRVATSSPISSTTILGLPYYSLTILLISFKFTSYHLFSFLNSFTLNGIFSEKNSYIIIPNEYISEAAVGLETTVPLSEIISGAVY